MLKIRLRRMGSRNRPYYRIVVSASLRTPRAEVVEEIGLYDSMTNPPAVWVDREKAKFWIARGAEASPTVRNLLVRAAESQTS